MTGRGSARPEIRRAASRRNPRHLVACAAVALTVALGLGLTGCADSAAFGLVRQACHNVSESLALYRKSEKEPDAKLAASERARAATELENASPLATEAAGQAPQWQALMATLAETSRLPEADLVQALQAQCAVVQTGGNPTPSEPVTTLPAPPAPSGPG
jgi:hypothetical protein